MTGRHAAPRDELFDQRERETAGSHRADVELPQVPEEAPAKKPAARAKAAPAKTVPPKKPTTTSRSKKANS